MTRPVAPIKTLTATMIMPAQMTRVMLVLDAYIQQLSVTTTRHASFPRATIKPDVRMPLSSATIIICVQSTFAITPLATAITHTLTVMTTTHARLTAANPLTDAYTLMSIAMTTTFVQMTRVIRIADVFIQISPASVRQMTNAQ
jgi:hypothetical protein